MEPLRGAKGVLDELVENASVSPWKIRTDLTPSVGVSVDFYT